MAEGLARALFAEAFERPPVVQSAGSRPSRVNPFSVAAMSEVGIGLSTHTSKSVDSLDPGGVDLVITLCADEVCPVALGGTQRLHWPMADPDRGGTPLTDRERLSHFRETRDLLRARIGALVRARLPGAGA